MMEYAMRAAPVSSLRSSSTPATAVASGRTGLEADIGVVGSHAVAIAEP